MIADEYAKAIFDLALESNREELINDNFNLFVKLLHENPDYLKVLTYPRISDQEKKDNIRNTLKGFEDIFIDFLFVLIDHKRMSNIFDIAYAYEKLIEIDNDVVSVDVYSAQKLTIKQIQVVQQSLVNRLNAQRVVINNIVDPTLIGGIKAVYRGKTIDLSVNAKLSAIKKSL
jgi:F-type H+-transporting ATPase subunit delta